MRHSHDDAEGVDRALSGETDERALAALARALSSSARAAGATAVASGRWLAEWLVDNTPRIPVRDRRSLEAEFRLAGPELAAELVRGASRSSATVGAAAGVLVGAQEMAPPAWLAIPMELVAETVAVAVIELKLVAELHEVYGRPVPTSPSERSVALVWAWAQRRGITPAMLTQRGAFSDALGRRARAEAIRLVRRRLAGRLGRNLSSLVPLLAGAVVGAEVNRRATRSLGQAVARHLEEAS
ncbi:MAG: hypothetical protein M3N31_03700 [Actinomycetota bacterium]|nr:hypothetical protein [Actinomycetota bacterium]